MSTLDTVLKGIFGAIGSFTMGCSEPEKIGPASERGPEGPAGQRGPAGPAGRNAPDIRECIDVASKDDEIVLNSEEMDISDPQNISGQVLNGDLDQFNFRHGFWVGYKCEPGTRPVQGSLTPVFNGSVFNEARASGLTTRALNTLFKDMVFKPTSNKSSLLFELAKEVEESPLTALQIYFHGITFDSSEFSSPGYMEATILCCPE